MSDNKKPRPVAIHCVIGCPDLATGVYLVRAGRYYCSVAEAIEKQRTDTVPVVIQWRPSRPTRRLLQEYRRRVAAHWLSRKGGDGWHDAQGIVGYHFSRLAAGNK